MNQQQAATPHIVNVGTQFAVNHAPKRPFGWSQVSPDDETYYDEVQEKAHVELLRDQVSRAGCLGIDLL